MSQSQQSSLDVQPLRGDHGFSNLTQFDRYFFQSGIFLSNVPSIFEGCAVKRRRKRKEILHKLTERNLRH